jgi:hypothetical protein
VTDDNVVAPEEISIENRLKVLVVLVEQTAEDIKTCSNVCDAYTKTRLLTKVFMGSTWDAKLLDFVNLFVQRRQEFQFELAIHTNQGVGRANMKLDTVGDITRGISEQFSNSYFCSVYVLTIFCRLESMKETMKALFQHLVSPAQKRLSELIAKKGGSKVLHDSDTTLLDLEQTASSSSNQPGVHRHCIHHAISHDSNLKVVNLRNEILEDPDAAADRNWTVFSRKFEAQKNHIIDRLTDVAVRESDRVIREVQGTAHERIRDRVSFFMVYCFVQSIFTSYPLQTIHKIWVDMVNSI